MWCGTCVAPTALGSAGSNHVIDAAVVPSNKAEGGLQVRPFTAIETPPSAIEQR
jgi:hypothetical protein